MSVLRSLVGLVLIIGFAACDIRYPNTGVEISDERPTIAFKGAPPGSEVFVDNLLMGPADRFDGRTELLLVEPGTHLIEVRYLGRTLLSERVILNGRATRTFTVQ